jgi:hypothetical protein
MHVEREANPKLLCSKEMVMLEEMKEDLIHQSLVNE